MTVRQCHPAVHRWVKAGVYPSDWACGKYPPPIFPVTEEDDGEAF